MKATTADYSNKTTQKTQENTQEKSQNLSPSKKHRSQPVLKTPKKKNESMPLLDLSSPSKLDSKNNDLQELSSPDRLIHVRVKEKEKDIGHQSPGSPRTPRTPRSARNEHENMSTKRHQIELRSPKNNPTSPTSPVKPGTPQRHSAPAALINLVFPEPADPLLPVLLNEVSLLCLQAARLDAEKLKNKKQDAVSTNSTTSTAFTTAITTTTTTTTTQTTTSPAITNIAFTGGLLSKSLINNFFRFEYKIPVSNFSVILRSRVLSNKDGLISHSNLMKTVIMPYMMRSSAGKTLQTMKKLVMQNYQDSNLTVEEQTKDPEKANSIKVNLGAAMTPNAKACAEIIFGMPEPSVKKSGLPSELFDLWKIMDAELIVWAKENPSLSGDDILLARSNLGVDIVITRAIYSCIYGAVDEANLVVPTIFASKVREELMAAWPRFFNDFVSQQSADQSINKNLSESNCREKEKF